MKVKAIASFFHGGSRKVGDEFEVSDYAGGLLEAKGLVSLVGDVELSAPPVRSPAADDPVGDSHQAGGLDAGLGDVFGTLEQNPDVVNADAATKEDETVVEPAQAELASVSANSSKAGGSKTKRSA